MEKYILKFTNIITAWHEKLFTWILNKSKTNKWFVYLLAFLCLYEIVEHFIIPAFLLYLAIR